MENNIKSIHIELNGDSDTYSVEISFTENEKVNIPYIDKLDVKLTPYLSIQENSGSIQINGIVLKTKEDTQNV